MATDRLTYVKTTFLKFQSRANQMIYVHVYINSAVRFLIFDPCLLLMGKGSYSYRLSVGYTVRVTDL